MVNIIEDWEVLLEYAGDKLGFFQVLEYEGSTEIRVQTGRIGRRALACKTQFLGKSRVESKLRERFAKYLWRFFNK